MAVVAVDFTHLDLVCAKGDELPDDHELVALAPHLFVQPDPTPETPAVPVRVRGPLVDQPATGKTSARKAGARKPAKAAAKSTRSTTRKEH